jgi:hypothetical protein
MTDTKRFCTRLLAALGVVVAVAFAATPARADDTIRRPGDHPDYNFEIEPHLVLGDNDFYGYGGYGIGVRAGIPIVSNGFITTINNSVAISFGLDWVHYDWCFRGAFNCSAEYFQLPVTLQWNFYVAQRWSVYGELGLAYVHAFLNNDPCVGLPNGVFCPRENFFEPALYLGGRYHMSDKVALNLRLGWPGASFGVSFFP